MLIAYFDQAGAESVTHGGKQSVWRLTGLAGTRGAFGTGKSGDLSGTPASPPSVVRSLRERGLPRTKTPVLAL